VNISAGDGSSARVTFLAPTDLDLGEVTSSDLVTYHHGNTAKVKEEQPKTVSYERYHR